MGIGHYCLAADQGVDSCGTDQRTATGWASSWLTGRIKGLFSQRSCLLLPQTQALRARTTANTRFLLAGTAGATDWRARAAEQGQVPLTRTGGWQTLTMGPGLVGQDSGAGRSGPAPGPDHGTGSGEPGPGSPAPQAKVLGQGSGGQGGRS